DAYYVWIYVSSWVHTRFILSCSWCSYTEERIYRGSSFILSYLLYAVNSMEFDSYFFLYTTKRKVCILSYLYFFNVPHNRIIYWSPILVHNVYYLIEWTNDCNTDTYFSFYDTDCVGYTVYVDSKYTSYFFQLLIYYRTTFLFLVFME